MRTIACAMKAEWSDANPNNIAGTREPRRTKMDFPTLSLCFSNKRSFMEQNSLLPKHKA